MIKRGGGGGGAAARLLFPICYLYYFSLLITRQGVALPALRSSSSFFSSPSEVALIQSVRAQWNRIVEGYRDHLDQRESELGDSD